MCQVIYNGKYDPKKTYINNKLLKSLKWQIFVYGAEAAFLPAKPEPPQFDRSRSRPKRWRLRNTGHISQLDELYKNKNQARGTVI